MFRHQCSIVCLALLSSEAFAACWEDRGISEQAHSIAVMHFAGVAQRMPSVFICSHDEFASGVGGDYNGAHHRIRIPEWQLQRPELYTVLVHELGHARVSLEGTDDGTAGGHGPAWMSAMFDAGFGGEARRVADHVPGAAQALAQVQPRSAQRPDPQGLPQVIYAEPVYVAPSRFVCGFQPQVNRYRDAWGRIEVQAVWIQVCSVSP